MKRDVFFPTLVGLVAILALTSISATYAWYQYQTSVSIGFGGTSLDVSKVFQVGLVSENTFDGEKYGLMYEKHGDKHVYWVSGEVTPEISELYLTANGYGTKYLEGVTSGKYVTGSIDENGADSFALKRAPTYDNNYVNEDPFYYYSAEKNNYLHFGLAFRTNAVTNEGGYVSTETSKVKLSKFSFDPSYNSKLKEAIRIHFNNEESGSGFIFNPSDNFDGRDIVGGILDLSDDGVYDTHNNRLGAWETVYGEYEELYYRDERTTDGVDGSLHDSDGDSFVAHHLNNAYAVDLERTVWCTSDYLGTNSVITNNKPLAETNAEGIAYFNMDIYLEGWDRAFTDDVMDQYFGCTIGFENL